MSVDPKVHELAALFIDDESKLGESKKFLAGVTNQLAQEIQDVIEQFIEYDLPQKREALDEGLKEDAEDWRKQR